MSRFPICLIATFLISFSFTNFSQAGIVNDPSFFMNTLAANDDLSTGLVPIGFSPNFFGTTYSDLYVNNNGNVTFTGPLFTFTPFGLLATSTPIIAPFFGDVDTTGGGSGLVHYGQGTYNGHSAFGATWGDAGAGPGVGYFFGNVDKLNKFQLVLEDRSDVSPGDFDIHFFYDQIQWETGDASGGTGGLGGSPARAGYSNGSTAAFELPGSGVSGAFLDGGPNSLVANSNVGVPMMYTFQARNGVVVNGAVPEPMSVAVWACIAGIGLVGANRRRKQNRRA